MQNMQIHIKKLILLGAISIASFGLFGNVAMADKLDAAKNEMNKGADNTATVATSSITTETKPTKVNAKTEENVKSELGGYTMEDGARQGYYGDGEYAN